MKTGIELQKATSGLRLVHVSRNVQRADAQNAVRLQEVVREGTTGRPVTVPRIWAVAEPVSVPAPPTQSSSTETMPAAIAEGQPAPPKLELAFYRKYTEAMLRRYLQMSTQVGRTPSLLGRELFRGNASHYKLTTFEDEVVFCVDVERCLAKLGRPNMRLIHRIAIQGYTLQEAAPRFGMDFRRCHERYGHALDQLTEIFLASRLLEPLKSCQDVETV
jgi:hypothetical protein